MAKPFISARPEAAWTNSKMPLILVLWMVPPASPSPLPANCRHIWKLCNKPKTMPSFTGIPNFQSLCPWTATSRPASAVKRVIWHVLMNVLCAIFRLFQERSVRDRIHSATRFPKQFEEIRASSSMVMVCLPRGKRISTSRLNNLFKLKIIAVQNILTESVHWKIFEAVETLSTTHRRKNSDPFTAA